MIGQTISHYRIIEQLGGGGMGIVYKAEDIKLKRTVALKFLPPELTRDKDAKTRFIHEAQAASALQHHNICTIHEIDETADGQLFISMDCYDGETLRERIARGPLPAEEAIDITCQIAAGLAKAHAAGMVHRDIKPANIIITGDGVVKILDFGLAKLAGQTKVTKSGTTLGTVAYMSPEQARGEELDARADIFSLGVVFYELLAGSAPFKGEHEAAVLYHIMNSTPEKLATLRAGLPGQLQAIVNRLLAKDLHKRYESCEALLADLMTVKASFSRASGSPALPHGRPARRAIAAVAVVIIAIAIAFMVAKHYLFTPSPDGLSLAVVDFSTVGETDDRIVSAGITNLLHTSLVQSSPIRVISPTYLQDLRRRLFGETRGPIAESQALEIARKAGATLVLTGQIGVLGDEQYVTWHLMNVKNGESLDARRVDEDRATDLADRIVADVLPIIAREAGIDAPVSAPQVSSLTTNFPEAYRQYMAGILAAEEVRQEDAVRHLEAAVAIDTLFALAYFELSRTYSRESGPGRAYAEKAWSLRERLSNRDLKRLQAWMAWIDYRVKDALSVNRDLLARWPEDREILKDLVRKLFANWYAIEAQQILAQGLKLYPDDYFFGSVNELSLAFSGRADEALAAARLLIQRHPRNPDAWDCLGMIYQQLGQIDSAGTAFHTALEIDPAFIWSQRGLAFNEYLRGNPELSIELVRQVLARNDLLPRSRLMALTDLLQTPSLAFLYFEMGRFEKSLEIIEEARKYAPDPEREMRHICASRNKLLLRMGGAAEVLAWSREAAQRTDIRSAQLKALEYRILSLVALDSLDTARPAIEELRAQENYWGGYALLTAFRATAEIALREGNSRAALDALRGMKPHGIPFGGLYDIEYREMHARAYRMAGRLEDAADVHREMLRVYGGHALSHYDLGQIYEEMGRREGAVTEYEAFLAAWAEADEGLPQVEDARTRLAALRAGS